MSKPKYKGLTKEEKLKIYDLAIKKLNNGKNWTKGKWFGTRDKEGRVMIDGSYKGPNKDQCFCLQGAIAAAASDLGYAPKTVTSTVANAISREVVPGGENIPNYNDSNNTWATFKKNTINKLRKEIQDKG